MTVPVIRCPSPSWRFSKEQLQVWNCPARTRVIEAGRGAGKSLLNARIAIREALRLYAERCAARANGTMDVAAQNPLVSVAVIADSRRNLDQTRQEYIGALSSMARDAGVPDSALYEFLVNSQLIRIGGSESELVIRFIVAQDEGTLRGYGFDLLHATEAAFLRETWLGEANGCLTRAGRAGIMLLDSTPCGPDGLWVTLCESAKDAGAYFRWTSYDNPFVGLDFFESLEAERQLQLLNDSYSTFQQERLAMRVLGDAGRTKVYNRVEIESSIVRVPVAPKRSGELFCGLDIAAGGGIDYTAAVIVNDDFQVVHAERDQSTDGRQIVDLMERLNRAWGGQLRFRVDCTANTALAAFFPQHLQVEPVLMRGAAQGGTTKERLVLNIRMLLNMKKLAIPHHDSPWIADKEPWKALVAELLNFQKRAKKDGGHFYSAPKGSHDDMVNALALAVEPLVVGMNAPKPEARATTSQVKARLSRIMYG